METRTLGATGLRVSRLGLGLAALGRPGYVNLGHADDLERTYEVDAMRARTHEVLDAAWDLGVRYVDAARSYGRAEQFLGAWLRARPFAARVTVGSKWGYAYTAGWRVDAEVHEVKRHSVEMFSRQLAETRTTLGDHLDLYQVHSATLDSGALDDDALLDALAELRDAGTHVGLTVSGVDQAATLRRALAITRSGAPVFAAVQATWNVLERSVGTALAEAHAAGLGVIIKEGLANGRLTARNTEPSFAPARALLEQVAERKGVGVDALALAAVLEQPWADVVLSGVATVTHLESNLRALRITLSNDDRAALDGLVEAPERYWATRSSLSWA